MIILWAYSRLKLTWAEDFCLTPITRVPHLVHEKMMHRSSENLLLKTIFFLILKLKYNDETIQYAMELNKWLNAAPKLKIFCRVKNFEDALRIAHFM